MDCKGIEMEFILYFIAGSLTLAGALLLLMLFANAMDYFINGTGFKKVAILTSIVVLVFLATALGMVIIGP